MKQVIDLSKKREEKKLEQNPRDPGPPYLEPEISQALESWRKDAEAIGISMCPNCLVNFFVRDALEKTWEFETESGTKVIHPKLEPEEIGEIENE